MVDCQHLGEVKPGPGSATGEVTSNTQNQPIDLRTAQAVHPMLQAARMADIECSNRAEVSLASG